MLEKKGWLVNDCLTCIPGTRTLWHDLLDWFSGLEDKTNGYTNYNILADTIEKMYNEAEIKPDYIIRNGSYFRKMNIDIPTFALIQDTQNNKMQTDVINSVTCIIFSSHETYRIYKDRINPKNWRVIEWASDFNFWKPIEERHPDVLPNSIIFIGDSSYEKKGFHRVLKLIDTMEDFNFCLIMKDDTTSDIIPEKSRNRVKIFNKANSETVRLLMNSSVCGICTSGMEEGHWAGIELGACNIPMVSRPMGRYLDNIDGIGMWGELAEDDEFPDVIRKVVANKDSYAPREYYSKEYTHERFKEKWTNLLNDFL
jgi:glycosyltransferase involved in cell wall biosynthesis